MRHFAFLYMCLIVFIVQSTAEETNTTTTISTTTHNSTQNATVSNSATTSSTHITSPSLNLQSQSSWTPSLSTTITQPLFTRPVVTTSTMAKPPLTPSPNPDSSIHPHGSVSAQYVHFGLLLISLMFLVVVEL